MRRPLALLATALSLAALPARAGEPLDLELSGLGAPRASFYASNGAAQAADARVRFARLATDLALGLSSSLLEPASTTGADGWDVAFEAANTPVSTSSSPWPTRGTQPTSLVTPSVHLRKAFPYSVELGGRLVYLSRSQLYASQLSLKWAFLEGFARLPDVAVRAAYTRMDGQRDLALATTEVDLLVSHRFGVNAIVSLTPYLGLRYAKMRAATRALQWKAYDGTTPSVADSSAAFPTLDTGLFRTTLGGRMTAYALSLAAELTYFGGVTGGGSSSTDENAYPRHKVPSSLAAALRLGFEF
jgi:hypothetical protein